MADIPSQDPRERVAQESYRRATALQRLDRATGSILQELVFIRTELANRPTRTEQTVRRRGSVLSLLVVLFLVVQLHNYGLEFCSPGARTAEGIDYVATMPIEEFDGEEMRELLRKPAPMMCGVAFPFHSENRLEGWPTSENLLGMFLYALALVLGYVWSRMPLWRERTEHHGDPTEAPPPPWDHDVEEWDGEEERRTGERRNGEE